MTILTDFDGTLVDLWPRYYSVFRDILRFDLNFDDYKITKQRLIKDSCVAKFFHKSLPGDYFQRKTVLLEERKYLQLDRLLIEAEEINDILSGDCIILTKRKNAENFFWQLSELGLKCKSEVVKKGSKRQWVERSHISGGLIIGDSLADLEVAKLPNFVAWMVGYGFGTKEQFNSIRIPYKYVEKPEKLKLLLKNRKTRRKLEL